MLSLLLMLLLMLLLLMMMVMVQRVDVKILCSLVGGDC